MTGSPLRELDERAVRHVAAGTGLTTIVTIGVGADAVPIISQERFAPQSLDASYERLLTVAADLARRHPRDLPAHACALILPERDVAYLHHHDTGTSPAQVLVVGRNPVDEPATRLQVSRGLATLMQALADTQPARPAAALAFLAHPAAHLDLLPPPPPPPPPAPGRPERPGPHR